MEVNDKVADFTLQTEEDKTVHLKDFAGKPVVLFFYPKADTPGCTIEACGFRDVFKKIQQAGAVVLGISRDTPKAQKKFKEKYDLPYTLLADVDEVVCKQFDVLKEKNMYGKKVIGIERTTFLIGPDRKLLKIFPKVKPEGHAEEVLAAVKAANGWGRLCQAFNVTRERDNGIDLTAPESDLQIQDDGFVAGEVLVTPRIGISKDAERAARFLLAGNPFVSGRRR
jgi:peroxiredoxin Q/BCP